MTNPENKTSDRPEKSLVRRYWAMITAAALAIGAFLTYYGDLKKNAPVFLCDTVGSWVELKICRIEEPTLEELQKLVDYLKRKEAEGKLTTEEQYNLDRYERLLIETALEQLSEALPLGAQVEEQAQKDLQAAAREIVEEGDEEERKAIALIADGNVRGGLKILKEIAEASTTETSERWRRLGRLAYQTDTELALKAYERLDDLHTLQTWDAIYLSRLYARSGNLNSAAAVVREALREAGGKVDRDRMVLLSQLGNVQRAQGDLEAALESYRSGMAIAEKLAASDPSNTGWQRDLSVSHNNIGDVQRAQGDLEAALESYRSGMVMREKLAASDPSNTGWQRDLFVSHNNIGDVQRAQGDLAAAFESYRSGLAIAEKLAASDPSNAGWQRDLSVSHERIGDVRQSQGDLAAALESYRSGLAIAEKLAASDPSNTGWQRDLSVSHNNIGDVQRAQGDLAAALESYRSGMAIREKLAASDPSNTGWQRDLSVSHGKIGDVLGQMGDIASAILAYEKSFPIAQSLADRFPNNRQFKDDLEKTKRRLAELKERL